VVVWVALVFLLVLRGGKGAPSLIGVPPCGPGYWAVTLVGFGWLLGVSILAGRRLVRLSAVSEAAGTRLLEGDVRWSSTRAASCLIQAFLAGIVAGLVGVGGGMVLGPMMLELSILPQVSTATTGTMVLLTSSSAAAVFLQAGVAPADYSIAFGLVATLGAYTGKVGITALVRRYRASALIILLLGSLIGISMLATTAAGLLNVRDQLASGRGLSSLVALRSICSAK